jgi:hypothetical protein
MANSQQGWQYPQPPAYPQGPVVPGSMAQSTRPAAMRRAVSLMYVGAALSLAFTKRAQLARAYGAAYYGYQPFGYSQAPQYGQPQYDESSPHNQEPQP